MAQWKSIEIQTSAGERHVRAVVFGAWAAHERWQRPDEGWVVTHLHTGLNLGFPGELSATEAIDAACALDAAGLSDTEEVKGQHRLCEAIVAEAIADESEVPL